jgi:nucleoside-diphosphate-sugar epimerase
VTALVTHPVTRPARVLVLGASGRLGMMLQRHWGDTATTPIWQYRKAPTAPLHRSQVLVFDPLAGPPLLEPVDLVISLAGIVPGKGPVSLNIDLGLAAVNCAITLKAQHVMLSSSAAVYGASSKPLCEESPARPTSAYGQAKLEMENKALTLAQTHGLQATMLRIGNVAGADALLGQPGLHRKLDRFPSGYGPVRSYIGPKGLSFVLISLIHCIISGIPLPSRINVAQRGGVAMEDLCKAAALEITWQSAPATALESVVLDVTCLAGLVSVGYADPQAIVADWSADKLMR